MMNRLFLACFMTAVIFSSCGGGEKNEKTQEEDFQSGLTANNSVQRLNDYAFEDDVTCQGRKVHYKITRHAVDSLDVVTDDMGYRYADNVISLKLDRDGQTYFTKSFLKSMFREYLEPDFYKHAILEGMVFDKVVDGNMRFAISISYPLSDLYIPFLLTVHSDGSTSIVRDVVLDNVVETMDTTAVEE